MIASTEKKKRALKLRIKGQSYNEINSTLGIPKSTLSGWFKDLVLTKKARARLDGRIKEGSKHLIKRNKMQTHLARKRARTIRGVAKKNIKKLSNRELLLVGVALYWGEGYKRVIIRNGKETTSHPVSFANSDADMVRVYINFLIDILKVRKREIKARVHMYPHMNENETRRFWMEVTGLNECNFGRPSYGVSNASKRRLAYNRLPNGTLSIQVNDTNKFNKVMGWIEGVKESV